MEILDSVWSGKNSLQCLMTASVGSAATLHLCRFAFPGICGAEKSVKDIAKWRRGSIRCSKTVVSSVNDRVQEQSGAKRRDALIQLFLSAVSLPLIVPGASAESGSDVEDNFRVYTDEKNKFKIDVPKEWLVGAGEPDGFKSVTAFYPQEASNSNVSVAITGIGPDFTRMESFGTVDAFAETLVNGLDRSWQRPPGLAAKLIDSRAKNGFYYIEYTLQNPGESRRHLFSAIGMASNGWYNRLYTVTGQYMEEESQQYRSTVEKVVSSFKFT